MTLLERLDIYPPYIVRRLAREKGRALRLTEIADRSGLGIATVKRYARMRSWASIPVGRAQQFADGCGHDLASPNKNKRYVEWALRTGRGFGYLNKNAQTRFAKLLK